MPIRYIVRSIGPIIHIRHSNTVELIHHITWAYDLICVTARMMSPN